MRAWTTLWALRLGMAATCLILVVGLALGIGPSTMVLRSVVVGVVLYVGLRILGGLVGGALLRLAVEQRMAKRRAARAEAHELSAPGPGSPETDLQENAPLGSADARATRAVDGQAQPAAGQAAA